MTDRIRPIYVLYGGDPYLCDMHRRQVISLVIGEADPQLCVSTFDATAELAEVLDELRTMPFLAPRRVVVVRDADAFVGAYRESLEAYLNSPVASSTLILTVSSWPSRTRLYKLVAKIGQAIDCSTPGPKDLARWLQLAASERGKKISPEAVELLVQWVGADMAALNSEIDKLSAYVGRRQKIDAGDVSAVVSASAGPAAFDLTNAITAGDAKAALVALDGMLTTRGDEFKTLGMIAWHLRRAVQAQQLLQAGKRPQEALPRMPYAQRDAFLRMLTRRPMKAFHSDFRRLIRADLAMKTGTDAKAAMQQLVVDLCT